MAGFRSLLAQRQSKVESLVCVGLDPLPEMLPACIKQSSPDVAACVGVWMTKIVEATAPYACMFKPQSAHWEAIPGGVEALVRVVDRIHQKFPDIPVFLDCKRGDIARTQVRYRDAHLSLQHFDGMNFSPYMGKGCMAALVDKKDLGKALVGLCYTSNPDAREIQDILLYDGVTKLWEFMAQKILYWAEELGVAENAGLVMAAAYELPPKGSGKIFSEHLPQCRRIVDDRLWFLIPGIGAQQGFINETVKASFVGWGSIAINSSSEIDFASAGPDFAEAAAKKAKELRDQINSALQ